MYQSILKPKTYTVYAGGGVGGGGEGMGGFGIDWYIMQ